MKWPLSLFALTLLLLTGCSLIQREEYDEETITEAKASVTSYIENNYESIEHITLKDPYQGEMGSFKLEGKANGEAFSFRNLLQHNKTGICLHFRRQTPALIFTSLSSD